MDSYGQVLVSQIEIFRPNGVLSPIFTTSWSQILVSCLPERCQLFSLFSRWHKTNTLKGPDGKETEESLPLAKPPSSLEFRLAGGWVSVDWELLIDQMH